MRVSAVPNRARAACSAATVAGSSEAAGQTAVGAPPAPRGAVASVAIATQRGAAASAAPVPGRSVIISSSPGRAGSARSRRRSTAMPPAESSARSSGSARMTAFGSISLVTQPARSVGGVGATFTTASSPMPVASARAVSGRAVAAGRLASGRPATTGSASSPNTTARNGSTSSSAAERAAPGTTATASSSTVGLSAGRSSGCCDQASQASTIPATTIVSVVPRPTTGPPMPAERPVPGTRGRHRHGRRPGHDGDRQPGRGGQVAAQHPVVHEVRGEGEQRGGRQGRGEGGETRRDGRGRPTPSGHRGQRRRGHQPRRGRRSRGDPGVQDDDRGQHPDQARREGGGHRAGPEGAQDGPEQDDGQEPEGEGGAPGGVDDRQVPGGQERLHDGELPHGEPVRRGQRDVAQLGAPRGERGGGEAGLAGSGDEPVTPHRDGEVHGRRGGRDQRRPEEWRAGWGAQFDAGFPGSVADSPAAEPHPR